MATGIDEVDIDDPCAVASALRRTLLRVIAGSAEERVRFRNGDVEEDVTFTKANLSELRKQLAIEQAACDALQGKAPRRYCATAG